MHEFFFCHRHNVVVGLVGYRRHMDESHEGRTDCVLRLTQDQTVRILRGESPGAVVMEVA